MKYKIKMFGKPEQNKNKSNPFSVNPLFPSKPTTSAEKPGISSQNLFPRTQQNLNPPKTETKPIFFNGNKNNDSNELFKRELEIRDKRIQSLELQVKTLTNAVNMCMTIMTDHFKKPSNPFSESMNPQQTNKVGNPFEQKKHILERIAPITLIGSEVVHSDAGYTLHRPASCPPEKIINMKVENSFGKIIFRDAINLLNTTHRLSECLKIQNSTFEVIDKEWKNKKCEIVLYNFQNYLDTNFDEKQNIIESIKQMKHNPGVNMQVVQFDLDLGNLYLTSKGL